MFKIWAGRDEREVIIFICHVEPSLDYLADMRTKLRQQKSNPMY